MKMIETLKLLWQHYPGETAAYGAIALVGAALLAVLLAAALLPTEPDEFEEVSEC